eukprot:101437_1
MSAFASIYVLFTTASISVHAKMCIWGATSNSIINGEYTTSTVNDQPSYSKSLHPNCGANNLNLYYAHTDSNGHHSWLIGSSTNTPNAYATCSINGNADLFTTDPSICDNNWQIPTTIDTSVTARTGACPSWNCKRIQITYSQGDAWCGMTYDQNIANNAWSGYNTIYGQQMYFYFDEYFMRWFCAPKYKKDCNVTYYDTSTGAREFTDLTIGNSLQIPMWFNTQTATVNCLDSVISPTETPEHTTTLEHYRTTFTIREETTQKRQNNMEPETSKSEHKNQIVDNNILDYVIFVVIGIILCIGGALLGYCFKRYNDNNKTLNDVNNINIDISNNNNESVDLEILDKEIILTQNELIVQKMKQMYTMQMPQCQPAMELVMSNSFVESNHRKNSTNMTNMTASELQLEGTLSKHKNNISLLCENEGDCEITYAAPEEHENTEKNREIINVLKTVSEEHYLNDTNDPEIDEKTVEYIHNMHNIHNTDENVISGVYTPDEIALPMDTIKRGIYSKLNDVTPSSACTPSKSKIAFSKSGVDSKLSEKAFPMDVTPCGVDNGKNGVTVSGGNNNINNAKQAYPITPYNVTKYEDNDVKSELDSKAVNSVYNEALNAYPMGVMTANGRNNDSEKVYKAEKAYPMNVGTSKGGYDEEEKAYPMSGMTSKGRYDNHNDMNVDNNKKEFKSNINNNGQKAYPMHVTTKGNKKNRFYDKPLPMNNTTGGGNINTTIGDKVLPQLYTTSK